MASQAGVDIYINIYLMYFYTSQVLKKYQRKIYTILYKI